MCLTLPELICTVPCAKLVPSYDLGAMHFIHWLSLKQNFSFERFFLK